MQEYRGQDSGTGVFVPDNDKPKAFEMQLSALKPKAVFKHGEELVFNPCMWYVYLV